MNRTSNHTEAAPLLRVERFTAAREPRKAKTLQEAVPPELVVEWAVRCYSLTSLAWEYVDTVLDISTQMRIAELKPLTRKIRGLRAEYDRFRQYAYTPANIAAETDLAEKFEDSNRADFSRLFYGIDMEVAKLDLDPEYRALLVAVHQALTLMEAVRIYARECDAEARRYGVWMPDCAIVPGTFLRLYPLIPLYGGDCYTGPTEAGRLTSGILVNRLKKIKITFKD